MARFFIESNLGETTQEAGDLANQLGGPFGRAVATARSAFATLNAVIAANPIGATLTIITAFITYIASNFQPVIDRAMAAFAAFNAVVAQGIDFFGSLLGLTERTGNSFAETARMAYELERAEQALQDRVIDNLTVQAERNAQLREAQALAADQTLSEEERIAALQRAGQLNREIFNEERSIAAERVRILEEQQALGSNTREDNEELARLRAMLINLDAQEAQQNRTLLAQRTALERRTQMQAEAEANRAAAAAERAQQEREREEEMAQAEIDRIRELRQEREIDLLRAGGATEQEVFEARLERAETLEEQQQIIHEQEVARIRAERAETEAAEEAERRQIEMTRMAEERKAMEAIRLKEMQTDLAIAQDQQTLDNLIGILGEGSAAGRAIAVTQATIKGIEGVQNAYTTAQSSPITAVFPAYPVVQAGIAAAFAGVQIQSILNTPAPQGFATTGPGTAAPAFGATVATPDLTTPVIPTTTQPGDQPGPIILMTPTTGPGSFESTMRINQEQENRRFLNRNSNG